MGSIDQQLSASPGNLWEMLIIRSHHKPTASETLGAGPRDLLNTPLFDSDARWSEDHCLRALASLQPAFQNWKSGYGGGKSALLETLARRWHVSLPRRVHQQEFSYMVSRNCRERLGNVGQCVSRSGRANRFGRQPAFPTSPPTSSCSNISLHQPFLPAPLLPPGAGFPVCRAHPW